MTVSPLLNVTQIAEDQANKYVTHNNAINALENAMKRRYSYSVADGANIALSLATVTSNVFFDFSGATGAKDVTFPSVINITNANNLFVVRNTSSFAHTIKASTGAGSTVVVAAGETCVIFQNYEDMLLISRGSAAISGPPPYDIGLYIKSLPGDAAVEVRYVAVRAFKFADNFAGSRGRCEVNPSGTAVFTVSKNGSPIGTVSINTSGVFTFATTGSGDETFAAGDYLTLSSPTPQDATLADVSFNFFGTRT